MTLVEMWNEFRVSRNVTWDITKRGVVSYDRMTTRDWINTLASSIHNLAKPISEHLPIAGRAKLAVQILDSTIAPDIVDYMAEHRGLTLQITLAIAAGMEMLPHTVTTPDERMMALDGCIQLVRAFVYPMIAGAGYTIGEVEERILYEKMEPQGQQL